ncbi:hypothetical protein HYFRA_00006055 [Hymenoscyphus fraxineus]|uniref:Uncharacterized protein n=1 Tax=Hymenoscyphus fraxineus TaxID=746836 RepID=A0A9N9PTE3_9HELO|nr:hypothetical protein HYFRA_00006055 [Hymenoscyphus fraxineus]
MDASSEKSPVSTNVLTITRPTPTRKTSNQSFEVPGLSTIEDVDSAHCLTPTHTQHSEKSAIMSPYASPFDSKQEIVETISGTSNTYTDLEAGYSNTSRNSGTGCKMLAKNAGGGADPWPNADTVKRQRKEQKRNQACCACWGALGKKQKLGVKIGSVLLVIIVITLMCVFISKAVGGGVWNNTSSNAPITMPHNP